jgi:hypothetical protein
MDNETINFEQVVAKGCGLDVHKETVVATVSGTGIKMETRTFSTFTRSLKRIERMDFMLRYYPCSHGKYGYLLETGI